MYFITTWCLPGAYLVPNREVTRKLQKNDENEPFQTRSDDLNRSVSRINDIIVVVIELNLLSILLGRMYSVFCIHSLSVFSRNENDDAARCILEEMLFILFWR